MGVQWMKIGVCTSSHWTFARPLDTIHFVERRPGVPQMFRLSETTSLSIIGAA